VPLLVHVVLPAVRARLAEDKRARGLFDYDDLLALVLDTLRSSRGDDVVRAVRGRYRHALVDEFQDTDERQWEIFRRLFVEPLDVRGGAGVPRVPTLTVIGDPKQAIYAFRGADVHTYRRACDALIAGGARRAVLDRSFRSSAALLEGLHALLAPAGGSFFSGPVRYEQPVRAARPALAAVDARGVPTPAVRVLHVVSARGDGAGSAEPLRAKALRRTLAPVYAAEIATLLDGAVQVVDEDGTHVLRASDVFVLTRTAAEGDEIADALRARGIPYAFFRKDGLFATDEAKDVLDVLLALVAPRDRRARVRALATPFFAVPLDLLGEARELAPEHPLLVLFERLVVLSQQRELTPLFRALIEDTGLSRRELYLHASERRLTNYLHLLEVLVGLSHRGRLSLRDLAERLAELVHGRARPSEDEDIQRLPSEQDAVQILTIHKAKGLEAHAVFLFGGLGQKNASERVPAVMHGPRSGSPDGRYVWAGPMPEEERARLAAEDDQEAQRLYYVALTRARSLLYLPYAGPRPGEPPREASLKGPYRVVHARLEALVREGLPPSLLRREVEVERGRRAPTRVLERPAPRTTMPDARVARLPASTTSTLRFALMGPEVTSYSRMKSRALVERPREAAVEEDRIELLGLAEPEPLPDPGDPLPGGTTLGVAVHEILERLPLDPIRARGASEESALVDDPALRAVAEEALARQGLDPVLVTPALGLALRALTTPIEVPGLSLPQGLAAPTKRLVEASFLHPIPEPEGVSPLARGLVRGVVDLLFEHEGRLWVLDWKTDRLGDYAPPAVTAHVHEHYEVQVRLYALACARLFGLRTEAAHEARFGGLLYVFLRGLDGAGAGLATLRPSFADLVRWERDLAEESAPWGYPLPPRRADALGATVALPEIPATMGATE
jgi:exodeoxyribonuclease V beta subunit